MTTAKPLENCENLVNPATWHPWVLNLSNYTLEHPNSYYVDLDRCRTSAEVLDWICQISHKGWATPDVLAGLVHALDELLYPQATLCSWGEERGPIKPQKVVNERLRQNLIG